MSFRYYWSILKQTFRAWTADHGPRLGAALAFYSVLSLAPLIVIVLAVAGTVFEQQAATGELMQQVEGMVGAAGAQAVQEMISHAQRAESGWLAGLLGAVALLFGASGVFGELQESFNAIWKVKPSSTSSWWQFARRRFLSLTMVLGTGFLLLASLVMSAMLHALGDAINRAVPQLQSFLMLVEVVISFGVITTLFALLFKVVPDATIAWRDVWAGALLTALLFTIGKALIGLYLGRSGIGSVYGAAGSLVVLVVWIYYSAQILFFGAEFTKIHAAVRAEAADQAALTGCQTGKDKTP